MLYDIIQVSKEMFTAEFAVNKAHNQIGGFYVQGSLVSIDAEITGNLCGKRFVMKHGNANSIDAKKPYRPYYISNNGMVNGVIYETESDGGWLKKYEFTQMQLRGMTYDLYSVALGKEGTKSLLYCGNRQIAQIDSESIVYNDLHNYRVYAVDEFSSEIAVMFAAYLYAIGPFEPGKKVKSSVTKYYSKTTNKNLLLKYNPNFIKSTVE